MSTRISGVLRAARAVANGEGDWAEVDPAVRDAIVLAITQASATPLRQLDSSHHSGYDSTRGALATAASLQLSTLPTAPAAAPAVLTEGNVQSSIQTFEDAAWVRDEAVRSYAEFHNNIEALHAAMRTQLHPVWKTSMQLRPGMLAEVRDHFTLSRLDPIPDGVPITAAAAQHIAQQEKILDEVEDTLQLLRNTSVRFAAHYLSDEEKISLGANPAYLRAPDIDREVVESHTQSAAPPLPPPSTTTSTAEEAAVRRRTSQSRRQSHSRARHDAESGLVTSASNRRVRHTSKASAAAPQDPPVHAQSSHRHHRLDDETRHRHRSLAERAAGSDPLLDELRRQYQQRVKELEAPENRTTSMERQGTWPQVGSVTSSRTSRSSSSQSKAGR